MATSNLDYKKDKIIDWIRNESDEKLIAFLNSLKDQRNNDNWWDDLNQTQKDLIQKGITDADKKRLITSEQFWKNLGNV